jgi:hypothetical protein
VSDAATRPQRENSSCQKCSIEAPLITNATMASTPGDAGLGMGGAHATARERPDLQIKRA